MTANKQRLMLLIILMLGLASTISDAQAWSPDLTIVQKLESSIQPSAYPKWGYVEKTPDLTQYARYYAGYRRDGHRLVAGEFVLPEMAGEKRAGIYIVSNEKKFPMISDGACSVVHVVYDVDIGRLLSLTCNGRA